MRTRTALALALSSAVLFASGLAQAANYVVTATNVTFSGYYDPKYPPALGFDVRADIPSDYTLHYGDTLQVNVPLPHPEAVYQPASMTPGYHGPIGATVFGRAWATLEQTDILNIGSGGGIYGNLWYPIEGITSYFTLNLGQSTSPQATNELAFEFPGPLWYSAAGVPEPSTWAILILGVAMIGFAARGRRQSVALA